MSENPLLPNGYDVFWSVVVLLALALLVWTFVSIARSSLGANAKLGWALIIFLLPVLGPVCWLAARPQNSDSCLS
jgi:hypothetical protein